MFILLELYTLQLIGHCQNKHRLQAKETAMYEELNKPVWLVNRKNNHGNWQNGISLKVLN